MAPSYHTNLHFSRNCSLSRNRPFPPDESNGGWHHAQSFPSPKASSYHAHTMIDLSLRARVGQPQQEYFFLACIRSGYRHSPIAIVGGKRGAFNFGRESMHVREQRAGLLDSQSARWATTTNFEFWSEKKNNSPPPVSAHDHLLENSIRLIPRD